MDINTLEGTTTWQYATSIAWCVLYCRSTTEVAGVGMESSLLRFARQHLQAACALPTGTLSSFHVAIHGGLHRLFAS